MDHLFKDMQFSALFLAMNRMDDVKKHLEKMIGYFNDPTVKKGKSNSNFVYNALFFALASSLVIVRGHAITVESEVFKLWQQAIGATLKLVKRIYKGIMFRDFVIISLQLLAGSLDRAAKHTRSGVVDWRSVDGSFKGSDLTRDGLHKLYTKERSKLSPATAKCTFSRAVLAACACVTVRFTTAEMVADLEAKCQELEQGCVAFDEIRAYSKSKLRQ
jgi:hypothetical protein